VRTVLAGADAVLLGGRCATGRRQIDGAAARSRAAGPTAGGDRGRARRPRRGLAAAEGTGLAVRVLNPPSDTFHPKLYLAAHGDELRAAIGRRTSRAA
jgi:hypothetical protein